MQEQETLGHMEAIGMRYSHMPGPCLCWYTICLCWYTICLCWYTICLCWYTICLCWYTICLCWHLLVHHMSLLVHHMSLLVHHVSVGICWYTMSLLVHQKRTSNRLLWPSPSLSMHRFPTVHCSTRALCIAAHICSAEHACIPARSHSWPHTYTNTHTSTHADTCTCRHRPMHTPFCIFVHACRSLPVPVRSCFLGGMEPHYCLTCLSCPSITGNHFASLILRCGG